MSQIGFWASVRFCLMHNRGGLVVEVEWVANIFKEVSLAELNGLELNLLHIKVFFLNTCPF
jgi:hypothetical protein